MSSDFSGGHRKNIMQQLIDDVRQKPITPIIAGMDADNAAASACTNNLALKKPAHFKQVAINFSAMARVLNFFN